MDNLVVYQDDAKQKVGVCSYDAFGRKLEKQIAEVAEGTRKEHSLLLHSNLPDTKVANMIAKRVAEWKNYSFKENEKDEDELDM